MTELPAYVAPAPAAPAPAVPAPIRRYPLRFTGSGGEYFRIWIVNLLLTILTVGIYSAWAKVRRTQYFYRNTHLDGAVFEYHGRPGAILKGRLAAVALIVFYNVALEMSFALALGAGILLVAVLPWLLRQSLRFRLHNTSYRGLRFRFDGATRAAYRLFGPPAVVLVLGGIGLTWLQVQKQPEFWLGALLAVAYGLLALGFPYLHFQIKRFQHNGAHYGQAQGRMRGRARAFYKAYGLAVLLVLAAFGAMFGAMFGAIKLADAAKMTDWSGAPVVGVVMVIVAVLVVYITFLAAAPLVMARVQNHVWNHTLLGLVGFDSKVRARRLVFITLTNLLAIIVTLGLYTPFAAVRAYRYKLEAVDVLSVDELGGYAASQAAEVAAVGEGAADLFDLDFSL